MTDRRRLPSTPGIPGARLPPPASVPPEERVLRELAGLEGRLLGRFADLEERIDRVESRHGATDEDVRAMRADLRGIREDVSELVGTVLRQQEKTVEHERDLGAIKTELVAAGAGAGSLAGAKRGAVTGAGAAVLAIVARWVAQRFGVDLP